MIDENLNIDLISGEEMSPKQDGYVLKIRWENYLPNPGYSYGTEKGFLKDLGNNQYEINVISNRIPGKTFAASMVVGQGESFTIVPIKEETGKYLVKLFKPHKRNELIDWEEYMESRKPDITKEIELIKIKDGLEIKE